jgi:hypothetical protein
MDLVDVDVTGVEGGLTWALAVSAEQHGCVSVLEPQHDRVVILAAGARVGMENLYLHAGSEIDGVAYYERLSSLAGRLVVLLKLSRVVRPTVVEAHPNLWIFVNDGVHTSDVVGVEVRDQRVVHTSDACASQASGNLRSVGVRAGIDEHDEAVGADHHHAVALADIDHAHAEASRRGCRGALAVRRAGTGTRLVGRAVALFRSLDHVVAAFGQCVAALEVKATVVRAGQQAATES